MCVSDCSCGARPHAAAEREKYHYETCCYCGSVPATSAASAAALSAAAVLVCSLDLPRCRRQLAAAMAGYLVSACRLRRGRIYSAASWPSGWLRSSTVPPQLRHLCPNRRDRRSSHQLWSADTTASTFTSTMHIPVMTTMTIKRGEAGWRSWRSWHAESLRAACTRGGARLSALRSWPRQARAAACGLRHGGTQRVAMVRPPRRRRPSQ